MMREWMGLLVAGLALSGAAGAAGCAGAADTETSARAVGSGCESGAAAACACDDMPGAGTQHCTAGAWGACACETGMFGNATPVPDAGATFDAGAPSGGRLTHCEPGLYLGTYDCELVSFGFPSQLVGDVAFNLEINEQTVECEPGQEFCADLVISEGSGVLFGLAVGWGFEAPLKGGLDCATGEFRTEPLQGVYGTAISSDPNDPDALWTVQQPPVGMFKGDLAGQHLGQEPQVIEGHWNLVEEGFATCDGGFTTVLQE